MTPQQRFAATVCAYALCLSPALAQNLTLTRPARSGVESLIGYERAWDRNCAARDATVTISRQPAHGVAVVRQGTSRIPATTPRSGSTGKCEGQTITGSQVMYRSTPGFRGEDFISWDVVDQRGGGGHVDVTIQVH